ncbi:MAG: amidohydrolase family protein [Anaerolineae bacterium]
MVIDAHAHIMSEVKGRTGAGATRSLAYGKVQWGDDHVVRLLPPVGLNTSFPPEVLLENMDWAGVDKAILLQGPFYGEVNEYVWRAVKQWPDRFIGAGYVDPRSHDASETFRRVTDEFGFRIIKFELSETAGLTGLYSDLRIDEEPMAWVWEEAERRGMVVTLDLGAVGSKSYQTHAVRNILDRHPKLKIVIAHLAQPPINKGHDEQLDRLWQDQVLLARNPNVWFDLSALPAYSSAEDYPYPTARQYIRRAVEMVGAERIMWGTDVPGLLIYATYPQLLDLVARYCDFLSHSDLARILGGNAWQIYGRGST